MFETRILTNEILKFEFYKPETQNFDFGTRTLKCEISAFDSEICTLELGI